MGKAIRSIEWSDNPLGPIRGWQQELKSSLELCLGSDMPMAICWGDELTLLYNDAWQQEVDNAPSALGRPAAEVFTGHLSQLKDELEAVRASMQPAELKDQASDSDSPEKRFLNYFLTPLHVTSSDAAAGVLIIAGETMACQGKELLQQSEKEPALATSSDLERLHVLSTELTMEEDIEVVLQKLMAASAELMEADKASVQIYDEKQEVLQLVDTVGADQTFSNNFQVVEADSFTTCAAALGKSKMVLVEDAPNNPNFAEFARAAADYGIVAALSAPLLSVDEEQLFGVFTMFWDKPHRPSDDKLQLLDLYTQQAARLIERKKVAQTLRRNEQHMRMVLESSESGAWDLNLQDGTAWRSLRHDKIFGYESLLPEWTYEKFLEHVLPEDREKIDKKIKAALSQKKKWDIECRIRRKDGAVRWIWARGKAYPEGSSQKERMLGIVQDITDRKEAQQALHDSDKKYRTLFSSIEEGFCIVEVLFDEDKNPVDYRFLEVNPAFEKQTGIENAEGKRMYEIAPDLEKHWAEIYGKVALTGKPARFENSAEALNRWFNVYAFRFGEPEERKVAVLFKDVSERVKSQQERERLLKEIKSERKKLADVFQHAPSFMSITGGPDHVIERANDLYYQLVGDRDIIGKPVREALPEAEEQGFVDLLDQVYQTGEAFFGTDVPVRLNRNPDKDASQEVRYVDFVYQPLRDSEGTIIGIFTQGVDLTERKHAKEKLEKMNETLEERVEQRTSTLVAYQEQLRSLASQLSKAEEQERHRLATELHDNLGQILTMCKMKIDLLQRGDLSDQTASGIAELTELMNEAIKSTRELMSDLKPPPTLDKEDLKESINWIVKKMEKHGLSVRIDDDEQPKPLSEEVRSTLLQATRELLFNVVKHAGVKEARLYLAREDGQAKVRVEDQGCGFDPKGEELVPTQEGGFGLFNLRERMDLLGGSLEVTSKPGKGTTAVLQVPLQAEQDKSADARQNGTVPDGTLRPSQQTKQTAKIKVLLADDHQMVRTGLRKIIEEEQDLTVIAEASNGREALKMARETSPDVIIMDVNMPVMNGIEATWLISDENPEVRIIGLSLHDKDNVAEAMQAAGASAYLTKGEVYETLCATIRSEAMASKE